jgi:hypothetical protein
MPLITAITYQVSQKPHPVGIQPGATWPEYWQSARRGNYGSGAERCDGYPTLGRQDEVVGCGFQAPAGARPDLKQIVVALL